MTTKSRILFCVPTTGLSGGVKVIFEIATRLAGSGYRVEIFSYAGDPRWHEHGLTIIPQKNLSEIPCSEYDFVLVSNPFMAPMILPLLGTAKGVYFCQDYEAFHHSQTDQFEDFLADKDTFREIYALPIPIITVSQSVRQLIRERIGRDVYYVPVGINKQVFVPYPPHVPVERKRVLMVGNYLTPFKGMRDGFAALSILNERLPVELVLVTQQARSRNMLTDLPYPVEVHNCPREQHMPGIMASCDAYCCTSWYEGLGLPGIESFHCGLPVVSTRDYGVSEYGIDRVNLLLADPNAPDDLADKLFEILTNGALAGRLRSAGFDTVADRYNWDDSLTAMIEALDDIETGYRYPAVDADAMAAIVQRLDDEGSLTPIETFRLFHVLEKQLDEIVHRSIDAGGVSAEDSASVAEICDSLKPYTRNPVAEYYNAFKSKLDMARLVLAVGGTPVAAVALRKLVERKNHDEPRTSDSLREITY